jgi:hypothetical protein
METLILQARDKKESHLLQELLTRMNIRVMTLTKEEQEDFIFGTLIKDAVRQGEAKPGSIKKIIDKWK